MCRLNRGLYIAIYTSQDTFLIFTTISSSGVFYLFIGEVQKVLIVYDSRAGKVKKFVEKLQMESIKVDSNLQVNKPFIFITYTDKRGTVPQSSEQFLDRCGHYLYAVAASGNKVFEHFAASADIISSQYGVPIIHKFEMAGGTKDVIKLKEWMELHETHLIK